MKWIVGLGNPGNKYRYTRHNIGFMAVDRFAEKWGIPIRQNRCKAEIGEGWLQGQKVVLIKPVTYMNLSGESVRAFMDFYKADVRDMIVVYDDLDTPFGSLRLRMQGSAGGHNGMKSLIQHTGTEVFNRIRVGISRPSPGREVVDYVLDHFTKEEQNTLQDVLETTCEALIHALEFPFDKVMAKFNR